MSPKADASFKPWEHVKAPGSDGPDAELIQRFVQSLDVDRRLYRHDITGSIAHARMLQHVGLLRPDELALIEKGLGQIRQQIDAAGDDWPGWKVHLEDVHMCIEAALIEQIGDAGRKLHTGRSRNDQVALDLQLWIQEAVAALDQLFTSLFVAIFDLARRDGQTVMPSYTHWQRAQPIVVGAEIMAWLSALDRAAVRIRVLQEANRVNPLGSGAIAGSGLPLDATLTSEALGVGPAASSSMDATSNRDNAIDLVYGLAMTAMTLSRWAEQWILYASSEFAFIRLDPHVTTGSSMMPQKQNPDLLELIRGRCGIAYGHLMGLLTICKGLSIGYSRDLQMDKHHLFAAYDSVSQSLEVARSVVAGTRFQAQTIAGTLQGGFLDATSLADYLVQKGVPFRTGHQIVGYLVRTCQESGLPTLGQLSAERVNDACQEAGAGRPCAADMADWLGAEQVVNRYRTAGNAGLDGFRRQMAVWGKRLDRAGV